MMEDRVRIHQLIALEDIELLKKEKDTGLVIEELIRALRRKDQEIEFYKKLSEIDSLTQVYNRLGFEHRWTDVVSLYARAMHGNSVEDMPSGVLVYVDLDKFKEVNDLLNHDRGDRVLVAVAQTILSYIRRPDLVARIGGDEFIVYLHGTSLDLANVRMREIHHAVWACIQFSDEEKTLCQQRIGRDNPAEFSFGMYEINRLNYSWNLSALCSNAEAQNPKFKKKRNQ